MKIRSDYTLHNIAGENIVVPVGDAVLNLNAVITLNDTANFLWQLLADGCERADLIAKLTDSYDVDEQTAAAGVDDFLATLKEHDILE